jgi:hypothetical protein
MLYDILTNAPWSILDKAKKKYEPNADGIVGSAQGNPIDMLSNKLQQLSTQQVVAS